MSSQAAPGKPFKSLELPRKQLPDGITDGIYRVYKDSRNFVTVTAPTAAEAFKASGLPFAVQILRADRDRPAAMALAPASVPSETVAAVSPATESPAPPVQAPEQTALSNDEVQNLLKS